MNSLVMSCIKYLLFFFNILFAMTGISILVVGALLQGICHHYSSFVNENFYLVPLIIIGAGGVIFFVAFFGCCGTVKENLCMISTFAALLLIVFIAEVVAAIGAFFIFQNDLKEIITTRMDSSLEHYRTDVEVAKSWDILQTDLNCCGVNGSLDWKDSIPQSCCPELRLDEACTTKDASENGCLNTLYSFVEQNSMIIIIVAVVVASVQLVGAIFACCVAHSIRKGYETV